MAREEQFAGEGSTAGYPLVAGQLGMLADRLVASQGQVAFGMQTATEGFVRAALRHGRFAACDFYVPGTMLAGARDRLMALAGGPGAPAVRVLPLHTLPGRLLAEPPLALHDPTGDFWRLHYLRGHNAPAPCPITTTHHTISYQYCRFHLLLPALLARYRCCDAIICTSAAARTAMAALLADIQEALAKEYGLEVPFEGRLELVPLGVDTAVFRQRDRTEARAQLGLPLHKVILLVLGRLSIADKMDLSPLLLVFRQLQRSSSRELLLVLAGSDPHGYASVVGASARELGLQEHVRLMTNVPPLAVPLLYGAADVFVSISDNMQEMCGQAPLEAMAAGLPAIVSDWDGYRETVVHGETGFRVPTLWGGCDEELCALSPLAPYQDDHLLMAQAVAVDTGKLYRYLKLLIDHTDLRRQLGEAARRRTEAEYDWGVILRQYEALWEELSRRADSLDLGRPQSLGFMRPDYSKTFAHFATRQVAPEMRLGLTEMGERAVKGREPLRLYEGLLPYFRLEALHQALAVVRVGDKLRRPVTVGAVARALEERQGLSQPFALRHVMWLLKYGMVALAEE